MAKAKCSKCGATAQADTFEQARKQLDHSIGLGRGIKCGDNYNCVVEIKPEPSVKPKTKIKTITPDVSPVEDEDPKTESPKRKSSKKE